MATFLRAFYVGFVEHQKIHGINWDDQSWLPWATKQVMSAQTSTERFGEMSKVGSVAHEPLRSHGQYCDAKFFDPKCQRFHPPNQWYPMIRSMRCSCRFFFGSFPPYRKSCLLTSPTALPNRVRLRTQPCPVVVSTKSSGWRFSLWETWVHRVPWMVTSEVTIFCLEWRTVYESERHNNLTGSNRYFDGIGTISWRVLHGFLTIPKINA